VLRSQDLRGVLTGHRAFVQAHPAATKPFRWAVRTASDRCATDPARVGRLVVAKAAATRDGYARQALREISSRWWRPQDLAGPPRFYDLRLPAAG
jgi:NitT/TauT family transport system substrate-binding protein